MVISVIDLGTSAVRLTLAQWENKSRKSILKWTLLERAELPIQLGKDIFTQGLITRETMYQITDALNSFKELISPYNPDTLITVGTTTLKEARNHEVILNQISMKTGLTIKIISGMETNQLTYLAVENNIVKAHPDFYRFNSLIMEVGAGNTELMLLQKGKISSAQTLPLGSMRLMFQKAEILQTPEETGRFYRMNAQRIISMLQIELDMKKISRLVAVGGDARIAARLLGIEEIKGIFPIPRELFISFVRDIAEKSASEISSLYEITLNDAELLLPALIIQSCFLKETQAQEVIVPSYSLREGLLINYAHSPGQLRNHFQKQILSSARNLARHYRSLNSHAEKVRENSVILFDMLEEELGLYPENRILLEISALLHDIGAFIGTSGHHKHGLYLILNSEIFGLTQLEKRIVANIVRYHRKALPNNGHTSFTSLDTRSRLTVMKMAALLRLADSLDRSHNADFPLIDVKLRKNKCLIITNSRAELSLERSCLQEKSDLFESVYGLKVQLCTEY